MDKIQKGEKMTKEIKAQRDRERYAKKKKAKEEAQELERKLDIVEKYIHEHPEISLTEINVGMSPEIKKAYLARCQKEMDAAKAEYKKENSPASRYWEKHILNRPKSDIDPDEIFYTTLEEN